MRDLFEAAPPGDPRMDRARAMGFDTGSTWYHATSYDFDEFVSNRWRGATYFSPTPEGALRGAGAGGMEHPALSGPTVAGAARSGLRIIPALIRGKVWGRDPLPLEWFPDTMRYGDYKAILHADADPVRAPGVDADGNAWLNFRRKELLPLVYGEGVPPEEYEHYTGDREDDLPLRRDRLPVPEPFFSYKDVEGMGNTYRKAMRALGFENWLVQDEGGISLAVSNPANIRVKHASFDPARQGSHGLGEAARLSRSARSG